MSPETLQKKFIPALETPAKYQFGAPAEPVMFSEAKIVFLGVPFDVTNPFAHTTGKGPEAIRKASAEHIETFVLDENVDVFEKVKTFDLGDYKFYQPKNTSRPEIDGALTPLIDVIEELRKLGKIPFTLGGEHTITHYLLRAYAEDKEKPIVIHFDAHRDMKPSYLKMTMCHTTPMYAALKFLPGKNFVQIGIRQSDKEETEIAVQNEVKTFDAWQVHENIGKVKSELGKITKNKPVYITIDIDALDSAWTPCTGTPEPFGLTPFQMAELLKSISPSARLVGVDMMEVGLKNDDLREGILATQLILRILCGEYVK